MALTILYAEDHKMVADAVEEELSLAGWNVTVCADGVTASRMIQSPMRYNLFLFDNELPGVDGLGLIRLVRKIAHYQGTPVVMLSSADCRRDALSAGADAFLGKPEGLKVLVETIAGLTAGTSEQ